MGNLNLLGISQESILERRARLNREIEERQAELNDMEKAVEQERILAGLRAISAAGGWLNVEHCHQGCLSGELTASETKDDGYDLQRHFGLDGYHDSIHVGTPAFLPGVQMLSVSANDGKLELHIGFLNPNRDKPLSSQPKLPAPEVLAAAKRFLRDVGISLKSRQLQFNLKAAEKEVRELSDAIAAVQAPLS